MMKIRIAAVVILFAMGAGQALAQQVDPAQTPPPKVPRPAPKLTFADRVKQYLQRIGSTMDDSKSGPDMVVSNYSEGRGGKVTVVLVNDRRRNLMGFYIYNFGSLKGVDNREEVYKYLLAANDSITIGSFFVDSDDDIGYKYLVSSSQSVSQPAFEYAYITMAAVARERKPEIKKLLGTVSDKDEKPPDVKKAAEEKPPEINQEMDCNIEIGSVSEVGKVL
jgi:putative sensory transduction regulator